MDSMKGGPDEAIFGEETAGLVTIRQIDKLLGEVFETEFAALERASSAEIEQAARDAVSKKYTMEQIGRGVFENHIHKRYKQQVKRRSIGSLLKAGDDLFRDQLLEDAVLEEEGIVIKLKIWDRTVANWQRERFIGNKTEQDRAYVRDMDFIDPVLEVLNKEPPGTTIESVWQKIKDAAARRMKKR